VAIFVNLRRDVALRQSSGFGPLLDWCLLVVIRVGGIPMTRLGFSKQVLRLRFLPGRGTSWVQNEQSRVWLCTPERVLRLPESEPVSI
jgi:hypothetical protein